MSVSIPVPETTDPVDRDRQAVAAVLRGDTMSYRELVERYQRLVYAVAWSRLGDATLAEDAAQEAFIRAYRSLALLGNGAKFSAWVTTIARNTAISLGIRQRRELEKRERWAVSQPAFESPLMTPEEFCPPEMLRQALADLPDEHRESLVLFYLEGKRGAEAATALGISEPALRMRLMRARAALRAQLEARLGESLERLQPSPSLVPGVMGAVVTSSAAKAGGSAAAGSTILAALGKVLPFKVAALVATLAILGPYLAVDWLLGRFIVRRDMRKFRDPAGIRARLFNDVWGKTFIGAVLGSVFFIIMGGKLAGVKEQTMDAIMGMGCAFLLVVSLRMLQIHRGKFFMVLRISLLLCTGGLLAEGFGLISLTWLVAIIFVAIFILLLMWDSLPRRMDSNLFLRERLELLGVPENSKYVVEAARSFSRTEQLVFARFLGERLLVNGFGWQSGGEDLLLQLSPVKISIWHTANVHYLCTWMGFYSARALQQITWICLKKDGRVTAHCGDLDQASLRGLLGQYPKDSEESANQVANAVKYAWSRFQAGQLAEAEQALGQLPETEIFHERPARYRKTRRLGLTIAAMAVGSACVYGAGELAGYLKINYGHSAAAYEYRGNKKYDKDDYAGAAADYDRALELDPKNASAYNLRGMVKNEQGDFDGAIADCTRSLALDSKQAAAFDNRGKAKFEKEDYNGALADLDQALARNAKDDFAYFFRGGAKYKKGDYDGAIADLSRDIELDPKHAGGFFSRGEIWKDKGNFANAEADFTRAVNLGENNFSIYFDRGRVRQCQGDWAGALADYNEVIKLNPQADYSPLYRQLMQLRLHQAPVDFAQTIKGWKEGWRKTLGLFVTDQIDESTLLAAAEKIDSAAVCAPKCEANYFIGEMRLVHGAQAGAQAYFQKAIDAGVKTDDAYLFAQAELLHLDKTITP